MTGTITQNRSWIYSCLLFAATLAAYLYSMPSTVALEDDGFFILSSYYSGISHPPGYPLHTIIGQLFTHIPLGTIAERVHAVSAFFGALTILLIFRLTLLITDKYVVATLAALGYAFSERFWSQAIIAEVYTLNTFLSIALIYFTFILVNSKKSSPASGNSNSLIALLGLIAGLGLANHWPLVILTLPGLVFIYGDFSRPKLKELTAFIAGLVVGLTPYVWMFFRSQQDPTFSFTGPLTDLQELIDHITRKRYQEVDSSEISGVIEKLQFAWFFIKQYILQFTVTGFMLSITGFITSGKYLNRKQSLGFILVFLGNSLVLIALLGFEYTKWTQSVISVYFLTAYAIAAITMALGFNFLATLVSHRLNNANAKVFVNGIAVLLIAIIFTFNLSGNDRSKYEFAENYARTILNALPENASLFADSDISSGPLGYVQHIDRVRQDIRVINSHGLLFADRLFDPKHTGENEKKAIIDNFIKQNNNVFSVEYQRDHELHEYWLYYKINSTGKTIRYARPDKQVLNFYETQVFGQEYNDTWTRLFVERLKIRFIPYIITVIETNPQHADRYLQYLYDATNSLEGMLAMINFLEATNKTDRVLDLEKASTELDRHFNDSVNRRSRAAYCNYKTKKALQKNDWPGARKYIDLSLEFNPESSNPAHKYKQQLLNRTD